jgi:secreted trypsin-like serine protease
MTRTKHIHSFTLTGLAVALLGACGEAAPEPSPNVGAASDPIVGGSFVALGELPYQVLVITSKRLCGGSIVANDWVLTAAHCVEGTVAADWTLRAGLVSRSAPGADAQTRSVSEIIVHPRRNPATREFDFALMRLATPWTPSAFVQPIDLSARPARPGDVGTVAGWGRTVPLRDSDSDRLKKTSLPVRADRECRDAGFAIRETMVCANSASTATSDCNGDSGSALAVREGGTWKQVGLVSWGPSSCDTYSVFADVWEVSAWIRAHLSSLSADIDGDGCVGASDYDFLVAHFGETTTAANAAADLNGDGVIDARDYVLLVQSWGVGC